MNTITIPKKLTKGEELVVIPKETYKRFLHLEELSKKSKSSTEFAIEEGLRDLQEGRVHGPFSSVKEFKKYLKNFKSVKA